MSEIRGRAAGRKLLASANKLSGQDRKGASPLSTPRRGTTASKTSGGKPPDTPPTARGSPSLASRLGQSFFPGPGKHRCGLLAQVLKDRRDDAPHMSK